MCNNKCKNIECKNSTVGKRVYCSLKCRNFYVNKYLRDYSKNAESLSREFVKEYESNPKYCLCCNKKIPYEKKGNKYCNHSCAATHTNPTSVRGSYNVSESGRKSLSKSALKNFHGIEGDNIVMIKDIPINCKGCGKLVSYQKRVLYCSSECKKKHKRKHLTAYTKYRADAQFTFNLSDYPDEFNFSLIEEYGWYKPKNRGDNIGGVSRDHIFSVREGFEQGVAPKMISHPANCRLMIHSKNISKNKRSDISLSELTEKINSWNKKYGVVA
jgi:hypothetical protein